MNNKEQQIDVNIILNENSQFGSIKTAIDHTYNFYSELTGVKARIDEIKERVNFISNIGTILSTENAASQILDYVRTTKYLRAVKKTLDHFLCNPQNKPVKIMYDSTGSFASLLLPLLCLYENHQIKIDVIEMNLKSLDALKKLVNELNYSDYFDEFINVSPVQYENSKNKEYDILICNRLQRALTSEPQVAVTLALAKYLKDEGILIPEKITVRAALTNLSAELSTASTLIKKNVLDLRRNIQKKNRIILGDVLSLDKNTSKNIDFHPDANSKIPGKTFTIPDKLKGRDGLIYTTEIKIIDGIYLREEDETGLTSLHLDSDFQFVNAGQKIRFDYQLGKNPKIIPAVL